MLTNKEYSLSLDDISYNVRNMDYSENMQDKRIKKLEEQESLLINFVKNDSKLDLEDNDIVNTFYFNVPIFIDDKQPMQMLRFELAVIVELNDKYGHNKYSYIFTKNLDFLKFLSETTIRFGKDTEDNLED